MTPNEREAVALSGMYSRPLHCVDERLVEMLEKYPTHKKDIMKCLDVSERQLASKYADEAKDALNADEMLKQFASQVQNQSFSQQ